MKYSTTLIKDPDMKINASSRLICECGWRGTVREAATLNQYNRAGELTIRSYICNRHLKNNGDIIILLEDRYDPPLDLNDQEGGEDKRKNDV